MKFAQYVRMIVKFPFALIVSVLAVLLSGYDGVMDNGDLRYQDGEQS